MLVINKDYLDKIGYQENIREKYSSLQFYSQQKDYALDTNLKKKR